MGLYSIGATVSHPTAFLAVLLRRSMPLDKLYDADEEEQLEERTAETEDSKQDEMMGCVLLYAYVSCPI